MQRPRRKKILAWVLLFILLIVLLGYTYRYSLIQKFQYSRLKSLACHDKTGSKTDCLQRLWVHRVNSLERFDMLKDRFEGFETDIVYDNASHSYSVYHPPLNAEDNVLSLKQFLKQAGLKGKHLWLDTRSVDASNMYDALQALNQLTDSSTIHNSLVIELYDMVAAAVFAENGYTVAFNVSELLQKNLLTDSILRHNVNITLESVKYVSQDSRYIANLKKFFPGKQIITWHPEFKIFFNTKEIQQLLDDPQVSVILVNIKSRYYK